MTVPMERDFDPAENFPSVVMDALQRMLSSGFAAVPVPIRIKPGSANTLQVAAGEGQDAIGVPIGGAWRWIESPAEQAGASTAGERDVWVCAEASDYEAGSPGETDATDRSFELRITAVDGDAPEGFAHTRRVARAQWNGSAWTDVAPIVGGALLTPGQVGDMKATARASAPLGWLLCDGAAVSRTTYAALFAAIGTTYGAGDGSTTFNLPDLRGRVPVGVDGAAGRLSANDALGQSGGSQTHTLTTSEMPSHSHTIAVRSPTSGVGNANVAMSSEAANGVAVTNPQGGGGAHNNMQPYQVVNWVIKT